MDRVPRVHMRCYDADIQCCQRELARSREESTCLDSVAYVVIALIDVYRDIEPKAMISIFRSVLAIQNATDKSPAPVPWELEGTRERETLHWQ